MNQKLLTSILFVLIIINIIAMSIIFLDIQVITAPETTVSLNIIELNQDSLTLNTSLNLKNPNLIAMGVTDIQILIKTSNNTVIGTFMLPGGYIDGGSEQIFLAEETISLSANSINEFKVIVATISANIKVEFLGIIEKTIPLKVILNTALEEVFDSIAIPTIGLSASVDEVNEKGVILTGNLNIFNPNPFSLTIDNLSIIIASSDKTPVGSLKIASGIVPPQESKIFPFIAEGNYTLFNKDILTIEIDAEAGAIIAGLHQTVSFGTQAELEIPDIRELLSIEDVLSVTLTGSLRLSLRGIQTRISLLLDNPSTLPLEIENTILLISRIDDEERSIILQNNMTVCTIGAQNQTCLEVEVTIPYRELLSKVQRKFLPDYLAITILGDATLEGINQSLPLEINGFIDPHLFRKL